MKRATLVSLVLLSLLVPSAVADQQRAHFNSTISIGKALPLYHGKVRSRLQSFCEPDRRVLLFQKVPGPDIKYGRHQTDIGGKWTIEVDVKDLEPGNKYYALTRPQDLGNKIYCEGAQSEVVTFVGE